MALRIAPLSLLCNSVARGFRRTVIVAAAVAEAMAKDPTLTSVNQAMSNLTLPFVGSHEQHYCTRAIAALLFSQRRKTPATRRAAMGNGDG